MQTENNFLRIVTMTEKALDRFHVSKIVNRYGILYGTHKKHNLIYVRKIFNKNITTWHKDFWTFGSVEEVRIILGAIIKLAIGEKTEEVKLELEFNLGEYLHELSN